MHQTKKEYEVKKIIKFIKREVKDVLSVTNPICISVNNMSNKISFLKKNKVFLYPNYINLIGIVMVLVLSFT